jgi:hypothetical protein
VIFNPVTLLNSGLLTADEFRSYAYDEDEVSRNAWDRDQRSNWSVGDWQLGARLKEDPGTAPRYLHGPPESMPA